MKPPEEGARGEASLAGGRVRDELGPESGWAWILLLVWVAGTALAAVYAAGWPTDNRLANWVGQLGEDPGYRALVEEFGGDEALLVRVRRVNGDRGALTVDATRMLTERLAAEPAVARVFDPLAGLLAEDPASERGGRSVEPVSTGSTGAPQPPRPSDADARPRAIGGALGSLDPEGPLNRALELVTADLSRADLVVAVRPGATPEERAALAREVEALAVESRGAGLDVVAAGHPLLAAALDEEAQRVERVFAPLLVVLTATGLALLLRSVPLALLSLLPAAWMSTAARGALRASGFASDLILVDVGPLVFVLVTASTVHFVTVFRRRWAEGLERAAAAREARRERLVAGTLAAATTAVGFGVFAWSGLRSVELLGIVVALSVLIALPLQYGFLPWLLARLPLRAPAQRRTSRAPTGRRTDGPFAGETAAGAHSGTRRGSDRANSPRTPFTGPRTWRRLALFASRHRVSVLVVAALVLVGGAVGAVRLPHETNALHYFPHGHHVRADFAAIENDGGALSAVEVLARRVDGTPWVSGALVDEELGERLGAVEGTRGVFGPGLLADELDASLGFLGRPLLPLAWQRAGRLGDEGRLARWTVRFPTWGTGETRAIVERVQQAATDWGAERGAEVVVTGSLPLVLRMQERLMGALAVSLLLTALCTGLCFLAVSRDPRVHAAALLTNLVPVAAAFGVAALAGLALDSATVMVGAVVLGLAVDNTFHVLHAGRGPRRRARLAAFGEVGPAAVASSLALAAGFLSLTLADFAPIARFGLLCAVGALAALVADLVVLPAVWIRRRVPSERSRGQLATARSRPRATPAARTDASRE